MNTKNINIKPKGRQGFTLIELLIVVALLGSLAALILPSMQANRKKAMEATCDFNQVSTIKALNDHYALNGALPNNLHTGSDSDGSSITPMALPAFTGHNISSNCTWLTMTTNEVNSCNAAGLTQLAYDSTNLVTLTTSAGHVAFLNDENSAHPFTDDSETDPVTFNGHSISWWNSDAAGAGGAAGRVFMAFISPITDWATSNDNDWGKGIDATLSVKKAGECKVPTDSEFNYYVAYIKAFSNQKDGEDIPAILVGTSCPECGITNP